eukprot:gnl/TRDRNA2_/TRDRNA2_82873_c0_seq1.p1 gnl/TRDRNA2_/TRDRNA2_82873_c0~~gnl/TRDRNA2_/TRDRNA2_82873_c0_seq1.p1  ORF type:complete len:391 (+),score=31.44 gnl/TRDRNA2_/TRDRNA2_82873_c0_seq1:109-1281(+)
MLSETCSYIMMPQNDLAVSSYQLLHVVESAELHEETNMRCVRCRQWASWLSLALLVSLCISQLRFVCLEESSLLGACLSRASCGSPGKLPYDQTLVQSFVGFAGAAYCSKEDIESLNVGWMLNSSFATEAQVCDGSTTHSYIARWGSRCVAAFEGTHDIWSSGTDFRFWRESQMWDSSRVKVHAGFLNEWVTMKDCILQTLTRMKCNDTGFHVTGHSLGGAVAGIAMLDLATNGFNIAQSATFGSPRFGDADFAAAFKQRFHGSFWRVTHHKDPVVQMPPDKWTLKSLQAGQQSWPARISSFASVNFGGLSGDGVIDWGYRHVEPEIFYDGPVADGFIECYWDGDKRCSGQYFNLADDLLAHINDHLYYLDVKIADDTVCGMSYSVSKMH